MKMFPSNWERFSSGGSTQTKVSCNLRYFSMVTKYCFPSLRHAQVIMVVVWIMYTSDYLNATPIGRMGYCMFQEMVPSVSSIDTNHSPYRNGKVIAGDSEQSSVPNIFAIGDMADGKLELTPVAIQAGKLLAQRLYGGSNELVSRTRFEDHKNATAVCSLLWLGITGKRSWFE